MAKVLIAYYSRNGHTEEMANYIAEGIRISGCEAETKSISEIKNAKDLGGYDAYLFGCPTYHRDMTANMKSFLFLGEKAGLEGKPGGAFGSYTHSGDAPSIIFETMEYVFKMKVTNLGSFKLKEADIETNIKSCQDYGRVICEMCAA